MVPVKLQYLNAQQNEKHMICSRKTYLSYMYRPVHKILSYCFNFPPNRVSIFGFELYGLRTSVVHTSACTAGARALGERVARQRAQSARARAAKEKCVRSRFTLTQRSSACFAGYTHLS